MKVKKEKKPKVPRIPNPCFGASLSKKQYPTSHYAVRVPFTPSNIQLRKYADYHKHELVMNWEAEFPAPTFNEDALRTLKSKYPKDQLYPLLEQYREVEKILGTYVLGMVPGPDGRVRGVYNHNPKTLRKAMKDPSLQVLPRSNDKQSLKARIKEYFVAAFGFVLLARDYSGIEAQLVAYFAGLKDLLRLTKIDVHGFIASHAIGKPVDLNVSDAELKWTLGELKKANERYKVAGSPHPVVYKEIRDAAKRALYLSMYGGTAGRMVQAEPSLFPTKKIAQWYQDLFFDLFPGVRAWQWKICEEAERFTFITCPSGFRMYFHDVFQYSWMKGEKKWEKKLGEVAKECIASKPQHMALMYSAHAMKRLWEDEELSRYLRLTIHDEIMLEVPVEKADTVDMRLQEVMEMPMKTMPLPPEWGMGDYLMIETESKRSKEGGAWSEMK